MAHGGRPRRSRPAYVRGREVPTLPRSSVCIRAHRPAFLESSENHDKHPTLLSSIHPEGMGPSMAMEGATTARAFEVYVELIYLLPYSPDQRTQRRKSASWLTAATMRRCSNYERHHQALPHGGRPPRSTQTKAATFETLSGRSTSLRSRCSDAHVAPSR